jgi:hypothetical protein
VHKLAPASRERVDYLWHDESAEDDILRALALKRPETPGEDGDEWLTPATASAARSAETAGVREILSRREPRSHEGLAAAYEEALDEGAERFHALVRGEIALSFEPVEHLRVTLSVVTPLLADARLKDAYDAAQEALRTTGGVASAVAMSHKERVDEALRAAARGSFPAFESVIDRALVEGRAFCRRRVFGATFVRGLLLGAPRSGPQPGPTGIPIYLPDAAADTLPLMRSTLVRAVVEVRPAQDAVEAHALGLRVVALARVVDLSHRRG